MLVVPLSAAERDALLLKFSTVMLAMTPPWLALYVWWHWWQPLVVLLAFVALLSGAQVSAATRVAERSTLVVGAMFVAVFGVSLVTGCSASYAKSCAAPVPLFVALVSTPRRALLWSLAAAGALVLLCAASAAGAPVCSSVALPTGRYAVVLTLASDLTAFAIIAAFARRTRAIADRLAARLAPCTASPQRASADTHAQWCLPHKPALCSRSCRRARANSRASGTGAQCS